MDHESLLNAVIFVSIFLTGTAVIHFVAKKFSFPYTVALLIAGFVAQLFSSLVLHTGSLELPPDFIFYVLLPILLFEGALHINGHELRLQFKTMTFLATVGLVISIAVIGYLLHFFANLPLGVALLFGAIISATDPIAVLALFKTLGAPKRLALIADGESMLNDATAVIAYRILVTFVVGNQAVGIKKVFGGLEDFVYVFLGSIIIGVIVGYLAAYIFSKLKNERVILTMLSMVVALGSFILGEHLHLSGVITTVTSAIVIGNVAPTILSSSVFNFVKEYWDYLAFLALSPVFFLASFTLDLGLFSQEFLLLMFVVLVVLFARAVSVYVSCFITNNTFLFKDEPNIPLSWQHILNWGGLRGVIPLVLVYSLPSDYEYRQLILQFTMATLLFTLFVNGLTVKYLLTRLGLHLPRKEEDIIKKQMQLFALEESRQKLKDLGRRDFTPHVIATVDNKISQTESEYKKDLLTGISPEELLTSLELQSIEIERMTMKRLFEQGRFSNSVYNEFDASLDLQQDELEHKEMFGGKRRMHEREYYVRNSFRRKFLSYRKKLASNPIFSKLFGLSEEKVLSERYALLSARLITSYAVCDYLDKVRKVITDKKFLTAVDLVAEQQQQYIERNKKQSREIEEKYPEMVKEYQEVSIEKLIFES